MLSAGVCVKLVEVCRVVANSGLEEEEGLRRSEAAAKTTKNTSCGTDIPSGWEGTDDLMILGFDMLTALIL